HTRFSRDWSSDVCSSDLTISEASVLVPEQSGTALLDEEAPADLIFVDGALPLPKKRAPRAPERPWLVADIEIEPVRIRVPDFAEIGRASGRERGVAALEQ